MSQQRNIKTFSFPGSFSLVAFGLTLFTIAILCLIFFTTSNFLGLIVLTFATLSGSWLSYLSTTSIVVNSDGITFKAKPFKDRSISWGEISNLKYNNWLDCYIVENKNGSKTIPIYSQLNDFGHLINILKTHRPNLFDSAGQTTFKRKPAYWLIFGMSIGIILLGAYLTFEDLYVEYIFIGMGLLLPITLLTEITQVRIEANQLILKYPLYKKKISKDEIEDFIINTEGEGVTAILYLKNGKNKKLEGFVDQDYLVYDAIQKWL